MPIKELNTQIVLYRRSYRISYDDDDDDDGWCIADESVLYTPVQVCRHGRPRHLEHLLFYGADVNAVNKTGNSPLHVCALNGQVTNSLCWRLLVQTRLLSNLFCWLTDRLFWYLYVGASCCTNVVFCCFFNLFFLFILFIIFSLTVSWALPGIEIN